MAPTVPAVAAGRLTPHGTKNGRRVRHVPAWNYCCDAPKTLVTLYTSISVGSHCLRMGKTKHVFVQPVQYRSYSSHVHLGDNHVILHAWTLPLLSPVERVLITFIFLSYYMVVQAILQHHVVFKGMLNSTQSLFSKGVTEARVSQCSPCGANWDSLY